MNRLLTVALLGFGVVAGEAFAQEQPAQPPQPAPVAAKRQIVVTWTLGAQEWDFNEVLSTYIPVAGELLLNQGPPPPGVVDDSAGKAIWTLEIARNLLEGEVKVHTEAEGSPLKAVLLDAEKIALEADLIIALSRNTGKKGDKLKAICILPKAEVLKQVKYIRIERRTKVGFETPQVIEPR